MSQDITIVDSPEYTMCSRCVMDVSDPEIRFDAEGVCNHCHTYDQRVKEQVHAGEVGLETAEAIASRIKRDGSGRRYDCVIGVSGGVDSTFVAWKVKELGLRPLAVHLDNGWNSEIAVTNIRAILKRMQIDLHTVVLDWEEFRDIQLAFLRASTPDAEIPSDHAIFASLYRTATAIGVRYVITGVNVRTESHLPRSWSQGHFDYRYIKAVHSRFGTRAIRSFPHYSFIEYWTGFRRSHETVNILDYLDYSKTAALRFLCDELGWRDYGGKHFESIYTRWFQGVYLPRKFGFDKRRSHLSSRICSGEINKSDALEELRRPSYDPVTQEEDCAYVARKLGLTRVQFDEIMSAASRRFDEFPSYEKLCSEPWFRTMLETYRFVRSSGQRAGRMIRKEA